MEPENVLTLIRIHDVEEGRWGSPPNGVGVSYVEDRDSKGTPHRAHLRNFLTEQGCQVDDGEPVKDTLLRILLVTRGQGKLTREELLVLLHEDSELDLSRVRP